MARTGNRKKSPASYRQRTYRDLAVSEGLISSHVKFKETDLHVLAVGDATRAAGDLATSYRLQIEHYIEKHPAFATSLVPLADDQLAPPIVADMLRASRHAGVGPMAAVAGSIAQYVGRGLIDAGHREIIVENGGDIFLQRSLALTVSVYAGQSPLSHKLGLKLRPAPGGLGICTSSGTVGHSLSFGLADSVTVVADCAAIADAAATRLGNEVGREREEQEGIARALQVAKTLMFIRGVLVVCGETLGAVGDIELVPLD
jgi:ApbE superfamily uncharacterized protein (UPF0280 family)